ncbi:hypothetical protein KCP74_22295 [Salmonella enterica subsp. enterica]|nr:hypothetical protein KCP74_22295 [Salmonella enterica subsp. enterica]
MVRPFRQSNFRWQCFRLFFRCFFFFTPPRTRSDRTLRFRARSDAGTDKLLKHHAGFLGESAVRLL